MYNIILLGPAGSGKGVQSDLLADYLSIPHISTGKLLRKIAEEDKSEIGQMIHEAISSGNMIDDKNMIDILKRRLSQDDCKKGFVLDGFPRNVYQARQLEEISKIANDNKNVIINLDIPDDVIIKRTTGRYTCKKCGAVYNKYYGNTAVEGICDVCGGKDFDIREDDSDLKSVRRRIDIYNNMSNAIIDFYRKKNLIYFVNGVNLKDKIHEHIKNILNV